MVTARRSPRTTVSRHSTGRPVRATTPFNEESGSADRAFKNSRLFGVNGNRCQGFWSAVQPDPAPKRQLLIESSVAEIDVEKTGSAIGRQPGTVNGKDIMVSETTALNIDQRGVAG
nr:hypothetical protein [Cryobacterium sp. Y11]